MLVRILLASACLLGSTAHAAECPPSVRLAGDDALVAAVAAALTARGIAIAPADCPAIAARVERRDQRIVVIIDDTERIVREVDTAATVIESFTRDVDTPLLAIPPDPLEPPAAVARAPAIAPPHPSSITPSLTPSHAPSHTPGAAEAPSASRGVHAFAGLETALASDRTSWLGLYLGGCVSVGPICLAARLRSASLASNPEDEKRQRTWELLGGIDIPFAVGGWLVSPGFGAGPSGMSTRIGDMDYRTDGVRADVHATVSIPLTARFALDLHAVANLLQRMHLESGDALPLEPWGFFRLGIGLRYGRR